MLKWLYKSSKCNKTAKIEENQADRKKNLETNFCSTLHIKTQIKMSPTSFILFFCAHNVLAIPGIEIPVGRRLYTGYKILRATPQTPQQRAALLVLEEGNLWRVNDPY